MTSESKVHWEGKKKRKTITEKTGEAPPKRGKHAGTR
jgi:hypothetical protein